MLRLKELREQKGISQVKIAKILGFAQNTISNWESGKRDPDSETILKIADCFGVTVDYLLGKDEKNFPGKAEDDTDNKLNDILFNNIESLSPEGRQKAEEYISMLKTIDRLKSEDKPEDIHKKA
jgi:transcriptional regulator with XRE-family HTH domain